MTIHTNMTMITDITTMIIITKMATLTIMTMIIPTSTAAGVIVMIIRIRR